MSAISWDRWRLGCLTERSFALLFVSQLISTAGDVIASVAVPFAIIQLGGGAGDIGVVLGARAVPLVIFLLVGGVWSDRLPRRLVMMGSDMVRGVCQVVFAFILVLGVGGIPAIVAIMFVYGSAEAFFRPALAGVVPQAVSAERMQEAYGLIATTPAIGMVLGGVLGGAAVALISPAGAIAIDAASFGIGTLLLAFARMRARATAPRGNTFLADLRAGWDAFRSRSWLVVVVVGESFYALLVMPAIFVGGPLIAAQSLTGATAWAAIITCFGLGFLIGGLTGMRLHSRRPLVTSYLVSIPFAAFFALLAIPAPVVILGAGALMGGTVIAVSGTLLETTITRNVPGELRSRVGSFRTLGSQVCQPVGFALIGAVIVGVGLGTVMWIAVAAILANVALVLGTPSVRALDDSAPAMADASAPT